MTFAGFNRRMRKTARPVVWKGHGVQFPVPPSNQGGEWIGCRCARWARRIGKPAALDERSYRGR